jgi:hypothetical protein
MNSKQHNKSQDQNTEELKQIPKWTRKYAQNRTLTILMLTVMVGLFGVLFGALVGLPLILAAIGFRKGNMILGCVGIAVSVALLVAYVKCLRIFVRKFGGKNRGLIGLKIDQWIYGREGMTSMPIPEETKKKKWLGLTVSIVWWCLFMGTTCLGMVNLIPAKYVQPISALYMVPWFVFIYFLQRPTVGPLFLICPILYTIHTLLILAGVPMFFTGGRCAFSIVLPFFGYWSLAYVIGHLYSRYALKKLRGLTHLEGAAADGD